MKDKGFSVSEVSKKILERQLQQPVTGKTGKNVPDQFRCKKIPCDILNRFVAFVCYSYVLCRRRTKKVSLFTIVVFFLAVCQYSADQV